MVNGFFDQGMAPDDLDEFEEEDLEDEGLPIKGGRAFRKSTGQHCGKHPEDPGTDSGNSRKSHRHDAKSRYWRKHRDDVQW